MGFWTCPWSGILKTSKHNVSEYRSVSVFRRGGRRLLSWVQWLRLALSKAPPLPEEENRFSFRNVVFSTFQNIGRWTKSKNPVVLSINRCFEKTRHTVTDFLNYEKKNTDQRSYSSRRDISSVTCKTLSLNLFSVDLPFVTEWESTLFQWRQLKLHAILY
jgi:hypothetical protein